MGKEIKLLNNNQVWELTTLPTRKKAITCKWVYKVKMNSDGSIERYKVRLVACGFDQKFRSDYDETDVSSHLYKARHSIRRRNTGQILKQYRGEARSRI